MDWTRPLLATVLLASAVPARAESSEDLARVRCEALAYADRLRVPGGPAGAYFDSPEQTNAPSLYASCDLVHLRTVMGEDLRSTLAEADRRAWIEHINSFARPDGTYGPARRNHSPHHANGMVVGALGALGGRQPRPVRLYDEFDEVDEIGPWLERVDWRSQWSGSHLFWGGMHCFSMSARCTDAWRRAVLNWLDANLDPATGWWRRGVAPGRPHDPLGGGAHIWPVYQHNGRRFPLPERVIDSILALQKPDGSWLGYGNYMELDALYGLAYMGSLAPQHRREDLLEAARRHGRGLVAQWPAFLAKKPDLHVLLGAFGLLQQLLPEAYPDTAKWTDIFSDRRLYRTSEVEAPPAATEDRR